MTKTTGNQFIPDIFHNWVYHWRCEGISLMPCLTGISGMASTDWPKVS